MRVTWGSEEQHLAASIPEHPQLRGRRITPRLLQAAKHIHETGIYPEAVLVKAYTVRLESGVVEQIIGPAAHGKMLRKSLLDASAESHSKAGGRSGGSGRAKEDPVC